MEVDDKVYNADQIAGHLHVTPRKVREAIAALGLEGTRLPIDLRSKWYTPEDVRAIWRYLTGRELEELT